MQEITLEELQAVEAVGWKALLGLPDRACPVCGKLARTCEHGCIQMRDVLVVREWRGQALRYAAALQKCGELLGLPDGAPLSVEVPAAIELRQRAAAEAKRLNAEHTDAIAKLRERLEHATRRQAELETHLISGRGGISLEHLKDGIRRAAADLGLDLAEKTDPETSQVFALAEHRGAPVSTSLSSVVAGVADRIHPSATGVRARQEVRDELKSCLTYLAAKLMDAGF